MTPSQYLDAREAALLKEIRWLQAENKRLERELTIQINDSIHHSEAMFGHLLREMINPMRRS